MFKKYYNLIVLLICTGAFPVQVVSSSNTVFTDPAICYFHDADSNDDRQIIKCDHCDYYYDIDSNQNSKYIFPINEDILVDNLTLKKNFLSYILSLNPRSPPLV